MSTDSTTNNLLSLMVLTSANLHGANLQIKYRMAQKKVYMPLEIAYHRCSLGPTRKLSPYKQIILFDKHCCAEVCKE